MDLSALQTDPYVLVARPDSITDLLPVIRQPKQVGHYTLPAAHLWCLPWSTLKEAHQKQYTLLDDWRWRVFTPPTQE